MHFLKSANQTSKSIRSSLKSEEVTYFYTSFYSPTGFEKIIGKSMNGIF